MTEPASRRGRPTLVKEPLPLDRQLLLRMHDLMVESRVLEERLIQMYRQGHGYFWIGGRRARDRRSTTSTPTTARAGP